MSEDTDIEIEIQPREHGFSTTIDVGGVPHKIEFKDVVSADDTDCYGVTDVRDWEITISAKLERHRQAYILFHEIIHAGLGVTGHSENMKEGEEEALVVALTNMLWPLVDFRPEIEDKIWLD